MWRLFRWAPPAPATGQAVVATGTLDVASDGGEPDWILRKPRLCALD
jgi:hypothetical protein